MPTPPWTPAKTSAGYPTPNYEDVILTEYVDVQGGQYVPLEYGTPYNDVKHTAFQGSYPNHKLVFQDPYNQSNDGPDKWIRRVWASDRVNQDAYNYSLKYSQEVAGYKIYTRVYILPRATYAAIALETPDPVDEDALLVAQQMDELSPDDPLASLYVRVIRVYETFGVTSHKVEYPYDDKAYPRVTTTARINASGYIAPSAIPAKDQTVSGISGLTLVTAQLDPDPQSNVVFTDTRVYETLPGPLIYSVSYVNDSKDYPIVTTRQNVSVLDTYTPGTEGATTCPITGYETDLLIKQELNGTDNNAIKTDVRVYQKFPGGLVYDVSYVNDYKDYPIVTTRQFISSSSTYTPGTEGVSTCPISGYESAILVKQQLKETENKTLQIDERTYQTFPGPLIYSVKYPDNDKLYQQVTTKQFVCTTATYTPGTEGVSTCPITAYNTLVLAEQSLNDTEYAVVKIDTRTYESLPGVIIYTYDYDTELNALVETTRQRIANDTDGVPPSIDTWQLDLRQQPIDKWRTLQIRSKLLSAPPTKVEYNTGSYPFPALVFSFNSDVVLLTTGRSEFWYDPVMRAAPDVTAKFKVTTSFHSPSAPNADTIWAPVPRNLLYRGISFSVSISNVLCDTCTLTAAFTGDSKYGDLNESVTFDATTVTATNYQEFLNVEGGTYKVVGSKVDRWRGNIWVKQTTEVLLV